MRYESRVAELNTKHILECSLVVLYIDDSFDLALQCATEQCDAIRDRLHQLQYVASITLRVLGSGARHHNNRTISIESRSQCFLSGIFQPIRSWARVSSPVVGQHS